MAKRTSPKLTRRRFLTAAGVALTGLTGYARWVEPHWPEVTQVDMPFHHLPAALLGRRLIHISDLHVGSTDPDYLAGCFGLVAELEPDLVAITGDFVTVWGYEDHTEALARLFDSMPRPPLGCFAALGNHDYGRRFDRPEVADRVTACLTGCGVSVLRNSGCDVAGLRIIGLDDLWAGRFRPADAFRGLSPGTPAVTLCHNPDGLDEPGWESYLGWVLSGHTHGGQCRPPFLPPPMTHLRNRAYASGGIDLGGVRRVYVNRGLGYTQKLRLNARPEITVFTLTGSA